MKQNKQEESVARVKESFAFMDNISNVYSIFAKVLEKDLGNMESALLEHKASSVAPDFRSAVRHIINDGRHEDTLLYFNIEKYRSYSGRYKFSKEATIAKNWNEKLLKLKKSLKPYGISMRIRRFRGIQEGIYRPLTFIVTLSRNATH